MKTYLMSWADYTTTPGALPTRQEILNFLDTLSIVKHWRASLGAIFIVTESPQQIGEAIRAKFANLHFVITPVDLADTWGWGDKQTWDFIWHPKPSGRH